MTTPPLQIPVVADLPVGQGLRDPLKLWLRYKSDKAVSVTRDKLTSAKSFLEYYFSKTGRTRGTFVRAPSLLEEACPAVNTVTKV